MEIIKKYLVAAGIFLIMFLIAFYGAKSFGKLADNMEYDYEVVTVTVTRCSLGVGKYSSDKVYVRYKGNEYELYPVEGQTWKYHPNMGIQAYLWNGKMFSDVERIKDLSTYGKFHTYSTVAAIFCFLAVLVCVLSAIIDYSKLKRKGRRVNL